MKEIVELKTVLDMLRFGMTQCYMNDIFLGHGTDSMWDEVLALVLYGLHLPYHTDPVVLQAHLTYAEKEAIIELFHRRIHERKPVAYLTNEAWFAGLSFYVDERVIIPRSPIAELIEQRFAPWVDVGQVNRILDLCTGSGCIAIACALAFPEAQVSAADISHDALVVAQRNCMKHQVDEQVALYESNLFSHIPHKNYDIIVSNPPYVSAAELSTLPKEYSYEPLSALQADDQGLAVVESILLQAKNYLSPQGVLILEVGSSAALLMKRYPHVEFMWFNFERGGDGVFLLTRDQLVAWEPYTGSC